MAEENSKWAEGEKSRLKPIVAVVVSVIVVIVGVSVFLLTRGPGGGGEGGQPPAASFAYSPSSPTAGGTVQFTDNSTDPDGTIVSWAWTFGDQTTSAERNPSHVYSNAGAYLVSLTVTDDSGASNTRSSVIAVSEAAPTENVFQDFESGNGTPGNYFEEIWQSGPIFETSTVHGGTRSMKITTGNGGGTVAILAANPSGRIDMSFATSISLWVYDTQGSNTIQLRLRDLEGDGGGGGDENYLWSSMSSVENQWKKITWDLDIYPNVPDLDLDRIASIEIYEWNEGTYYLDDVKFS